VFALSLLLASFAGARARASEGFVLEAACVSEPELKTRLQPLLPAGVTAEQALRGVAVRVQPAETEHSAEIHLPARGDEATGLRVVRGDSCASAVEAAILVIGVWSASAPPAAPPVSPAPPPPPRQEAPVAAEPLATRSEAGAPLLLGATLSVGFANAFLPSPALGVEVGAMLGWRILQLTLGVRVWPAQSRAAEGVAVEAGLVEDVLRIAWQPLALGAVALGPALALALGELRATSRGTRQTRPRSVLWARSELELRARIALLSGWLGMVASCGVSVAWSRPSLVVVGEGTLFQPARFAPYASLGLEATLE
jgi:hypothetical protein